MLVSINLKQEWLEANNWDKRYNFIEKYLKTHRLKRLFSFNCAKSPEVYKLLTDPRSINALELVDKYLDGKATEKELIKAKKESYKAWDAYYVAGASAYASTYAAYASTYAASAATTTAAATLNQPEYQAEIFVKLLRPEWEFNPNWITEITTSLATRINDEKRFDLAPILADALEDCGCCNKELLEYLRTCEEMFKGDWIVDNLTNKR